MTSTAELITRVRESLAARERQLDEDEQWALAANQTYPHADGHIARWDPFRVLHHVASGRRDIEAKRIMLDFLDTAGAPEGEGRFVAERAIQLLATAELSPPAEIGRT
jgi:hypothetical protein